MPAFIQAENLTKTYRVGKVDVPALRGVSFEVQSGDFVTIVGPSGSGNVTQAQPATGDQPTADPTPAPQSPRRAYE